VVISGAICDNKLWARVPLESDVTWRDVGHANNVAAMTAIDIACP
jgi:hypothetical protein